ncbi:RNA processing protein [Saccharomyces cerevisiae]|uniref:LSM complex subunit LSM4 n=6 Tax=Saccharomyces TaxID=4930 RepID=G2WD12_YEASK|nr:regulatory protein [Saccharomyces cerevisiae]AJP38382.1 Lsm4p [Saccharomyces cerevisiae YJM1078]AJU42608.1 Lsm4p [Saccharomyces cerevisiae YJM1083]AJU43122.1 Lsm4p [Saccharomyces cerevisiae YJM1133]AJU43379.1 Lsm4p [Saccharomyces cerevisiae YJM1190]AJU43632.1 Lsm4p [Saccharomyces cerevisiae YJM1199]AJU43883.1 Lsm4p [Saccharomyces cerevisiae YJM1202]AJU44387.1 Lsm4p [Saccharomyces cerevisiae YJM1242]AJU44645.1 Lsm4p [Saccharomyces cerevisiae YJM1244]AJU44900.1 Lsm4p [Saccharomyces cerevi
MLPLYLLTNAKGQQMQIELKNGEIIQGILTNVDNWMNLTLSNVTEYSEESAINSEDNAESSKAVKLNEIYIRGTFIKFIKLQDNIIDKVKQQINSNNNSNSNGPGHKRYYNNRDSNNNRGNYNRRNNNNGNSNRRPYSQNRQYNNSNSSNINNSNNSINSNNQNMNNGLGGSVQHHFNSSSPQKVEF